MVRSLRVVGAVLSVVAGATSALSVRPGTAFGAQSPVWGSSSTAAVDDLRRAPVTSMSETFKRDTLVMMPATIEREAVKIGRGPAVLERPVVEKTRNKEPIKEQKKTGSEAWEVRIYNDGMNTREFVARCLVQVVGLSEITAFQTMMQAHQFGIASVGQWVYERAEMYFEQLKNNGIVCDIVPVDDQK